MNNNQSLRIWDYLLLFIFIYFAFYFGFSVYALENMNEGLYAEIAREMLVSGNYLVPHLNFVPYLEKPPMLYWLIALSYKVFGISTFAARLIPVSAGALLCLVTFYFAKKMEQGRSGWFAAIILATSVGFILISRVIIFDMLLAVFFTAGLCCFYAWYTTGKRYYLWLTYVMGGFAFMTKGLFVILLMPALALLFMVLNKTPVKRYLQLISPIGIILFLLTVVPWVVAATMQQSDFAWNFFVNEQFMRFLNKRIPHDYHTGAIYYYVPAIIVCLLPWTFLIPTLLKRSVLPVMPETRQLKKFLWAWFLGAFIFFSLSQAKAHYYIILGIPALALLMGMKVNEYFQTKNAKVLSMAFLMLMLLAIIGFAVFSLTFYNANIAALFPENMLLPTKLALPLIIVTGSLAVYGIVGIIANRLTKHSDPKLSFLLLAGAMVPLICFLLIDKQYLQPERSAVALSQYILSHDAERPVYLYRDYEKISTVLFFVQKRVSIIDSDSKDLYFGSTTPAAKGWFITTSEFISTAKQQPVYIVTMDKKLPELNNALQALGFCPVAKSGETTVLSNVASECQQVVLSSN